MLICALQPVKGWCDVGNLDFTTTTSPNKMRMFR
jgi:hypothetical protein